MFILMDGAAKVVTSAGGEVRDRVRVAYTDAELEACRRVLDACAEITRRQLTMA